MNELEARELINEARKALKITSDSIQRIISNEAWKPLGYSSFQMMWEKEFGDIVLASEVRSAVVYAMLEQGESVDNIAHSVNGVGPDTANELKRKRDNGIPHNVASAKKRKTTKRDTKTVFVDLAINRHTKYEQFCRNELGLTLTEFATKSLIDAAEYAMSQQKSS